MVLTDRHVQPMTTKGQIHSQIKSILFVGSL